MHARRRLAQTATVGLGLVLTLAACTGEEEGGEGGGGDPTDAAGQPGFDTCAEEPNTCNSGERADGGTITWLITSPPGAWSNMSPEGGSVYTLAMIQGVYPHTGYFEPDGETYHYNMDLFAEEPELLSEDPHSWQYVIRDEAVWNDGTPITADDFEVTWKLMSSEDEGHCVGCRPRGTSEYDRVASVEGSDDGKTVTVTLKDGEFWPEWFSWTNVDSAPGAIMPAHIAEENGFDVDDPEQLGEYFEFLNNTRPTWSGGPYQIVEGEFAEQVIKEPNPMWYGEEQPTLDTLITQVNDDQGGWVAAVNNGEVDGLDGWQLNEDVLTGLQEIPNGYTNIRSGPSWEHIDINLDHPQLQDVALRRAIFTAIDTADMAERHYGQIFPDYTLRTNHIFSETSPYHVDHLTETGQGSGDTEAAMQILTEAGYELQDGTLTLDGEQIGPFRLRSTVDQLRSTSMQLVQSYLAEIGVEVTIETTDDLGGTLGDQDYDLIQYGWSGSPLFVDVPDQQWQSDSGSNWGNYSNPQVDELIEQINSAPDQDTAAELTNQAIELVVQDAYVLPLWDSPVYTFVTDEYTNIRDNTSTSARVSYNNHEWGMAVQ